jgi:hypothetical protein
MSFTLATSVAIMVQHPSGSHCPRPYDSLACCKVPSRAVIDAYLFLPSNRSLKLSLLP